MNCICGCAPSNSNQSSPSLRLAFKQWRHVCFSPRVGLQAVEHYWCHQAAPQILKKAMRASWDLPDPRPKRRNTPLQCSQSRRNLRMRAAELVDVNAQVLESRCRFDGLLVYTNARGAAIDDNSSPLAVDNALISLGMENCAGRLRHGYDQVMLVAKLYGNVCMPAVDRRSCPQVLLHRQRTIIGRWYTPSVGTSVDVVLPALP